MDKTTVMDMRSESRKLRQAVESGHKYYVMIVGSSYGCDYTMGCNIAFHPLAGDTLEEATKGVSEHLGHDEYHVETALVIEASQLLFFDVQQYYKDAEKQKGQDKADAAKQSEQAEYERLKAKFG